MTKKRTKKQKLEAAERRREKRIQVTDNPTSKSVESPQILAKNRIPKSNSVQNDIHSRIGTPLALVYKDLMRTLVISGVCLVTLFGIYVYLR